MMESENLSFILFITCAIFFIMFLILTCMCICNRTPKAKLVDSLPLNCTVYSLTGHILIVQDEEDVPLLDEV